jgi:hypothetical protein
LAVDNHEWEKQDPVLDTRGLQTYINGYRQTVDHYIPDEQEKLKMTDRISVITNVQGNGPEIYTYTDKETAYEINIALRERFESLTELVERFCEVVKVKGSEFPEEWFSEMLYLNCQGKWNKEI